MTSQNFLVAGATGRQGSSAVEALFSHPNITVKPSQVYCITRDDQSSDQRSDLKDSKALFEQVKHVDNIGVFLAQAHGPTEVNDAKNLIDAAIANRAAYFVYSSVDRGGPVKSPNEKTCCKTFSDKYIIEKYLEEKANGVMDYTILRPTWFIDNTVWGFPGKLCMTGWRDNMKGQKMQVTATKDIGRWAAEALLQPDRAHLRNTALSIASDELTYDELCDIYEKATDKQVETTNAWMTKAMIWAVNDFYTMFKWIGNNAYGADLKELSKYLEPTTFQVWAEEQAAKL